MTVFGGAFISIKINLLILILGFVSLILAFYEQKTHQLMFDLIKIILEVFIFVESISTIEWNDKQSMCKEFNTSGSDE